MFVIQIKIQIYEVHTQNRQKLNVCDEICRTFFSLQKEKKVDTHFLKTGTITMKDITTS